MRKWRGKKSRESTALRERLVFGSSKVRIDPNLMEDLGTFAAAQSIQLREPATKILSQAAREEIALAAPRTFADLEGLHNLRGDLPTSFYQALLETVVERYVPEPDPLRRTSQLRASEEAVPRRTAPVRVTAEPDPPATLTPAQQLLDHRLRSWRNAEAERLNLPNFFVLGASTLRSLVLTQPRNLAELRATDGIGLEKSEKFGAAILGILNA